jgi:hemerythrin superfamily protein
VPSPGQDQGNRLMDVIITDHREVEQMFHELETGVPEPEERRKIVDQILYELVRHSVAEEQLLYPMARKVLPDGHEIADRELVEHQEAERTMKKLEGIDGTDPEFEPTLRTLMAEIRHHVQDEERNLLPRLGLATGVDASNKLGDQIAMAKKMAPARPHPAAPDTPPANMILGPMTGLVDKLRDLVTGRGR